MYTRIYEYSEGTKKRFRVIGFKGYRPMPGGDRAEPSEHDFKLDESLCLFFSFQISTLPYSNPYTLCFKVYH